MDRSRLILVPLAAILLVLLTARAAPAQDSGLDALAGLLAESNDADLHADILTGMLEAMKGQRSVPAPAGWDKAYRKLSQSPRDDVREKSRILALLFGDPRALAALRATVVDPGAPLDRRRKALAALLDKKDAELVPTLYRLVAEPRLRAEALRGLAAYDDPKTPGVILRHYVRLTAAEKAAAVGTLSSRPAYVRALLDAMAGGQIARSDLSAFAARQILRFKDDALTRRLGEVWGSIRETAKDKQAAMARYRKLLTPADLAGADAPRGRAVYTRVCAACHTLFGEGGKIGPDLTGSNRVNLEYVLENVLDPNAMIGRDYQMTVVQMTDGRVIAGMVKEQSPRVMALQSPTELIRVPRAEIEKVTVLPNSMMPEGLFAALKPQEVRDLVTYLASPRQVPLPKDHKDHAFRAPWTDHPAGTVEGESLKVLGPAAVRARPRKAAEAERGNFSGGAWLQWTGFRSGDHLTLELPVARAWRYELSAVMVRDRSGAIVRIALDGRPLIEPVDLYHDSDVAAPKAVSLSTLDLSAGNHRLTVQIMGANPAAQPARAVGLDYVVLKRID
ncbi:MAG: c-type cytochrome [Phycisphaerae bacterium]|nr:c-type cytochrome [Phycisphaerae bacterium]